MKAIILAAGRGSRMKDHTLHSPKCYTMVCGKRIIDYILAAFRKANIDNISIVTGYKSEVFKFKVNYIHNSIWNKSNMVYSLLQAKEELLKETCIVSYSDIIYTENLIKKVASSNSNLLLPSNINWKENWEKRYKNPLEDLETFRVSNNKLVEIGQKPANLEEIDGQYMGIIKFTPNSFKETLDLLSDFSLEEIKKMDMTSLLNLLINKNIKIDIINSKETWYEIDNETDLKVAEHGLKYSR